MTLSEIAELRHSSQQLAGTKFTTPVEMVSWFCAIQAQEYAQTKWSLGLRLKQLTDIDIEQYLVDGRLLRTHLLRPTWHLVTAEDIRWLLKLTAPYVHAANAFMYRKLELNAAVFNHCNAIIIRSFHNGKQLTREAIHLELSKNKIEADGLRLSYIMMQAELEGILCSGARQGKQFTYALLEERVPPCSLKSHDESLAELTSRYFNSRGPATIKDFSQWSGISTTECKKGLSMIRSKLIHETVDNEDYYFTEPQFTDGQHTLNCNLLPVYDEYIMGYKKRDALFIYRNNIEPAPALRFDNTIIHGNQITGTWKRTIQPKKIDLEYNFFIPPNQAQIEAFQKGIRYFEAFNLLPVHSSAIAQ